MNIKKKKNLHEVIKSCLYFFLLFYFSKESRGWTAVLFFDSGKKKVLGFSVNPQESCLVYLCPLVTIQKWLTEDLNKNA